MLATADLARKAHVRAAWSYYESTAALPPHTSLRQNFEF
jgi:hypothetical protein